MGKINPQRKKSYIRRILARDGHQCALCGDSLNLEIQDGSHALYTTLDHIKPRSFGGRNCLSNLQLAHKMCNTFRGNRSVSKTRVLKRRFACSFAFATREEHP